MMHDYHELAFVVDSATDRLPEPGRSAFRDATMRVRLIRFLTDWDELADAWESIEISRVPFTVYATNRLREWLRGFLPLVPSMALIIETVVDEYIPVFEFIGEEYDSLFVD